MYSLYRAWFGGEETYPHLETLSPPDTLVRVGNEGEHQFVAHRGVLAAHSGYLKALLATATSSTSTSARDDATSPVTSVSVSSVGGEAFAPLLNYMYTGRLEVTLENIYSVLLATHLLHMPGALEQCRAALLRLREPPPPLPSPTATRSGTVLRPVPSRLVGPPLCWSQQSLYPSGPVGLSHLPNLQLPPSISMLPSPGILQEPPTSTVSYSFRDSPSPPPVALELRRPKHPEVRSTSPEVATTSCRTKDDREKSLHSPEDEDKNETDRISVIDSVPSPLESNERTSATINEQSVHRRSAGESSRSSNEPAPATSTSATGVVYDVACCDGPVRFHRVLNENYTSTSPETIQQRPRPCSSEEDVDVSGSVENDENGRPEGNSSAEVARSGSGSSGGTASYTCGYCRHTFKSHYCYRKHARRHLLPTAEADRSTTNNASPNRPDGRRREVKLLDLNVQYYPCKICGSKFPSYYFVHKHRKLCHASADDRTTGGDGDSSSAVAQGTSNSSDP